MKKLLLFGLVSLISVSSYAQEETPSVATGYPDLEPVTFKELRTTKDDIDCLFAESPDGKQITITSVIGQDHTEVVTFDTNSGKVLWNISGGYARGVRYVDAGLLLYDFNHMQLLDPATGEDVWARKPNFWTGAMTPVYANGNILIAYNSAENSPFVGLDMKTGERIWKKRIQRTYGIAEIYDIDDTHSFIVTNRLYKIDWTTGQTEDIKINIGDVSGKRVWAQIGLGFGVGMYPTGSYSWRANTMMPVVASWEVLSGRVSNIEEKDGLYYMADQDYVRCFDQNLQVRWQTPLPEDIVTQSFLELHGDTLVMANVGTAYKGAAEATEKGLLFVAAFDIKDGTQLRYRLLSNKATMVTACAGKPDRVVMACADSCMVYSVVNDELRTYPWNVAEYGKLSYIPIGNVLTYDSEDHIFKQLGPDEDCVMTNKGEAYVLPSTESNYEQVASSPYLYVHVVDLSDGRSIILGGGKREDCWIINADGSPSCHIDFPVYRIKELEHHVAIVLNNGRTLLVDI
ncbi:MAG: PQQ-like beta-propeller repeat protein [Bacteroidales bacterium]|nr:PQQ-like beta-propeller repeat protein [Bacteroidales bacterium]